MTPAELTDILHPIRQKVSHPDSTFSRLLTDSRSLGDASSSLFFAIPTKRNTGARYVEDLYSQGVRNFVISVDTDDTLLQRFETLQEANIWYVSDVVRSLQLLASQHRSCFDIPVVGITGSNGKTICKDWIVQLLSPDHHLCSSPKSYNSQIGVPLSVWQLNAGHDMAVFEAGVSTTGEMEALRNIIQPTIGIFTNIGQAHDENFLSRSQKVAEKLHLFTRCQVLIYCTDQKELHSLISEKAVALGLHCFTWGSSPENDVVLTSTQEGDSQTLLQVAYQQHSFNITIPFVDRASIENAMQCVALLFYLGYDGAEIARRCLQLAPVAMRLELIEGINGCLLVNDSYSLDINSLGIALDFVQHERQHERKTLIMSDFQQSGMVEQELYSQVAAMMQQKGITRFVGIGEALCRCRQCFEGIDSSFYETTSQCLQQHDFALFQHETILLKGARMFRFERIAQVLQYKSHETIMEVDLSALVSNLNYYRSLLQPTTRLMAMVKASSYGAGKVEVANALQYNHVDYLTVAYADEGVELRRQGITLPIMVMNPEEESFGDIIRYQLEPDIYSFRILQLFNQTARLVSQPDGFVPVHIEFDTGMHRLGFDGDDIPGLVRAFSDPQCRLRPTSTFSHLACSEDPSMDDFTQRQIDRFRCWSQQLKDQLHRSDLLCHILNSSGITRFPEAQMDMVRLGIGLYGIAPQPEVQRHLTSVSHIRTRISQLKAIPEGDPVGYNGRWVAPRPSTIAIIPIGYADGLTRRIGYGRGRVTVAGQQCPIVGSICMDMCFVDVTGVDCCEGDEVLLFPDAEALEAMAQAADTIPYEVLTSISPRVRRVYIQSD